jgi:hypothetical protein
MESENNLNLRKQFKVETNGKLWFENGDDDGMFSKAYVEWLEKIAIDTLHKQPYIEENESIYNDGVFCFGGNISKQLDI